MVSGGLTSLPCLSMRLLRGAFIVAYAATKPKVPDVHKHVVTTEEEGVPGGQSETLEITSAEDGSSVVEDVNLIWVMCFPD